MRALFVFGIIVLILGIASFFVPVPRTESHGIKAGNVSIGVQERHDEKLPPWVGGLLIAGGVVMMVAGGRGR